MSPGPALRIERAVLRNAGEGGRQQLERALEAATPAATGVPETAMLVIRRMVLDRPLPKHASERFGACLVDAIRERKRGARRGRTGSADDDLFFEDESDFEVAIVAATLAGGSAARRLVALTGGQTALMRWRTRILDDTRLLPALIERLAAAELAVPWLVRFEPVELMRASTALLRARGAAAASAVHVPGAAPVAAGPRARRSVAGLPEAVRSAWAATDRARDAGPQVRLLLFAALVAARRPDMLATEAVQALLVEIAHDRVETAPAPRTAVRTSRTPSERPDQASASGLPAIAEGLGTGTGPARRRPTAGSSNLPAAASDLPPDAPLPRGMLPIEDTPGLATDAPESLTSRFAGLFFVVNILLALGFYGDFTRPAVGLPGLSPFELILILGKRWFGKDFERDPLASLLRELAGLSPRGRPGRHFEAPRWHVPRDWVAAWPGARVRRRAGRRWHEAGFPLADRARPRTPAQARRRWFDCLSRYVAARLAAAFGEPVTERALVMLVRCPGRVEVDRERIDIVFDIERHPVMIRLAGLDRDPGWLAAAARDLRFRFE